MHAVTDLEAQMLAQEAGAFLVTSAGAHVWIKESNGFWYSSQMPGGPRLDPAMISRYLEDSLKENPYWFY